MEMWHRGKRSKNMVLTIEDTKSIPALMEVVKEIDNKILSIEKKSDKFVFKLTLDNKSSVDYNEFITQIFNIDDSISIKST